MASKEVSSGRPGEGERTGGAGIPLSGPLGRSASRKVLRDVDQEQVLRSVDDKEQSSSDLMARVEGCIPATDLIVNKPKSELEFFEHLGRKQSSLAAYSSKRIVKKSRSRREESTEDSSASGDVADGIEGITVVEDSNYESDDDFKTEVRPGVDSENEILRPVASWVKTMNHFEMRKNMAEDLVRQGVVYSELPAASVVPIQLQADLDLYSYREQRRRWECGQSAEFQSLCRDLWRLVRSENDTLGREQYIELVSRFHYICCPPPLDEDRVMTSTHQDWANDSGGEASMDYALFFRAIFQCVDIWTETSRLDEYVALLQRLVEGASVRLEDNRLAFKAKEAIHYDEHFSMHAPAPEASFDPPRAPSSVVCDASAQQIQAFVRAKSAKSIKSQGAKYEAKPAGARTEQRKAGRRLGPDGKYKSPYGQQRDVQTTKSVGFAADVADDNFVTFSDEDSQRPSEPKKPRKTGPSDVKIAADEVLHRTPKKRAHEMLLSADQVCAMISKCYRAKLQADAAVQRALNKGKKIEKSVRFDLFVVRFFKRSHGTIGIARRHLRVFVRSIEALLESDPGDLAPLARHPRIALFAEIVGISTRHHNARLCPSYLVPVLRALYPDAAGAGPHHKTGTVRRGELGSEPVAMTAMLEALLAVVPISVRGAEIASLLKAAIEPARINAKHVDPDQALWLALPTFKKLDALVAFRRRRGANVAQDYAKRYLQLRKGTHVNDEQQIIASCNLPAKKIAEARSLDAELNAPAPA